MAKRPRKKRAPNRSATRSAADRPLRAVENREPDAGGDRELIASIRATMRSEDPTAVVTLVSSMLSVTDAWPDPLGEDDQIPLDALVDSFVGTPFAETTVALHVIAALLPDDLDAARVRRGLTGRRHPLPEAVGGLRDLRVVGAARIGDELGDGDNVILGLDWPGIGGVTVVTYVDEAFGTRVKDVFLVPEPFTDVCDRYRELLASEGRRADELEGVGIADARASIEAAIALGDAAGPDAVPDDWAGPGGEPVGWPGARPFVEMLLRRMPAGGRSLLTSDALPEVSVGEALAGFFAARSGAPALDEEIEAVRLLLHDAAEHAGHPLRWSPVQVELALTQRLPFAIDVSADTLEVVPDVLPRVIRYAHRRLGVAHDATEQTVAAVAEWLPAYRTLCDAPSAVRWRDIGSMVEAFQHGDHGPLLLRSLADDVGGPVALERLDDAPLPHEPLDLEGVAPDVRDALVEISGLIDRWLDESPRVAHLGPLREEWRTACRRLLVGATAKSPGWLRRRGAASGRACGLLWATGVPNRLVGPHGAVLVKDLAADFGVTGAPSTKAETLLRAWRDGRWLDDTSLGDAGMLVSQERSRIIRMRDEHSR